MIIVRGLRKHVILIIFFFLLLCFTIFFILMSDVGAKRSILIPLPSECVRVDKVEGNKIYLKDDVEQIRNGCKKDRITFKQISFDAGSDRYIYLYYNGALWKKINYIDVMSGDSLLSMAVESFLKEAEVLVNKTGSGIGNREVELVRKEVAKFEEYINSEEYKSKIDFYHDKLVQFLLNDTYNKFFNGSLGNVSTKDNSSNLKVTKRGDNREKSEGRSFYLGKDERIYIFISTSVPDEVIRDYVVSVDELRSRNIVFVLRGAVGGLEYIGPTVKWVMSHIMKDRECIVEGGKVVSGCRMYSVRFIIDPLLYRKYSIDKVPAVLYVKGIKLIEDFSEGLEGVVFDKAVVSYGDNRFAYHLFQIGKVLKDERFINYAKEKLVYVSE